MARQTPTQTELDAVFNTDFDTAVLPADVSLDLGARTVYGTTDPSLDLSMVNVRHLNNTRKFRGTWEALPTDGNLTADPMTEPGLLYKADEVVIGSDAHLYQRLDQDLGNNFDPTTTQGSAHWRQLSAGLEEAVTELTSTPSTQALNLYAANSSQVRFNVEPTADSVLIDPVEFGLTVEGTLNNGNPVIVPFNVGLHELTVTVPNGQTDENAAITVTTSARSASDNGATIHEGGQVDSEITFVDARVQPRVTQTGPSEVSRVMVGNLPERISFSVDLTPDGTSVDAGTAYDVQWTARATGGTATPLVGTDGNYLLPHIMNQTNVNFSFPFSPTVRNGQAGSMGPQGQDFVINPYTPWFWQILPTTMAAPSSLATMQESLLVGDTTGRDFPIDNTSRFSVTGAIGDINNLWLAVPTVVNREITLTTGIASMPAFRTTETLTAPLAAMPATMVDYTLYVLNFGLVASPTTFTISSTPI